MKNAFAWAASSGDYNRVQELINQGIDINAKREDGITALMLASQYGLKEIVEILKKAGAK